jgi:hypothetical protein
MNVTSALRSKKLFIGPGALTIAALVLLIVGLPSHERYLQGNGEEKQTSLLGFWNGFNGQINVVECESASADSTLVSLILYDHHGTAIGERAIEFAGHGTVHTILNDYPISDDYGTYGIRHITGEEDLLQCHTMFYREAAPETGKPVEYAYSLPLAEALQGRSSGIYNSINPGQNSTLPVLNWLTIYNMSEAPLNAEVRVYRQDGSLSSERGHQITGLRPSERIDLALGHPNGMEVGTYEIIPENQEQQYAAFLIRYSRTDLGNYQFAFALPAREGAADSGFVPASTAGPAANWAEIANAGDQEQTLQIEIFSRERELLFSDSLILSAHSQHHISLNQYLGESQVGFFRTRALSDQPAARLLVNSVYYGMDAVGGKVQWAYASASPFNPASGLTQAVFPLNTFYQAANWLKVINAGTEPASLILRLYAADGSPISGAAGPLRVTGSLDLALHEQVGLDFVGMASLSAAEAADADLFTAEFVRTYPQQLQQAAAKADGTAAAYNAPAIYTIAAAANVSAGVKPITSISPQVPQPSPVFLNPIPTPQDTRPPVSTVCTDSDGGPNANVTGTVIRTVQGTEVGRQTDNCSPDPQKLSKVLEYDCDAQSNIVSSQLSCAAGRCCEGGACANTHGSIEVVIDNAAKTCTPAPATRELVASGVAPAGTTITGKAMLNNAFSSLPGACTIKVSLKRPPTPALPNPQTQLIASCAASSGSCAFSFAVPYAEYDAVAQPKYNISAVAENCCLAQSTDALNLDFLKVDPVTFLTFEGNIAYHPFPEESEKLKNTITKIQNPDGKKMQAKPYPEQIPDSDFLATRRQQLKYWPDHCTLPSPGLAATITPAQTVTAWSQVSGASAQDSDWSWETVPGQPNKFVFVLKQIWYYGSSTAAGGHGICRDTTAPYRIALTLNFDNIKTETDRGKANVYSAAPFGVAIPMIGVNRSSLSVSEPAITRNTDSTITCRVNVQFRDITSLQVDWRILVYGPGPYGGIAYQHEDHHRKQFCSEVPEKTNDGGGIDWGPLAESIVKAAVVIMGENTQSVQGGAEKQAEEKACLAAAADAAAKLDNGIRAEFWALVLRNQEKKKVGCFTEYTACNASGASAQTGVLNWECYMSDLSYKYPPPPLCDNPPKWGT